MDLFEAVRVEQSKGKQSEGTLILPPPLPLHQPAVDLNGGT